MPGARAAWREDYRDLLVRAHIQLDGSIVVVWDNLNTHLAAGLKRYEVEHDWLTTVRLPAYASDGIRVVRRREPAVGLVPRLQPADPLLTAQQGERAEVSVRAVAQLAARDTPDRVQRRVPAQILRPGRLPGTGGEVVLRQPEHRGEQYIDLARQPDHVGGVRVRTTPTPPAGCISSHPLS